MNDQDKLKVIENYIHAYNHFDLDGMLRDIHKDIRFENISGGKIDLTTRGIDDFKVQAEYAMTYFKERRQKILKINFYEDRIELDIDFFCVLAVDLSEKLKSGDTLKLKGKSIFTFKENKIIGIHDFSV